MLIRPKRLETTLLLHAFSFAMEEINILRDFLKDNRIEFSSDQRPKDRIGRLNFLFTVYGNNFIQKIQKKLGVDFVGNAANVILNYDSSGQYFRCVRVKADYFEEGCKTFTATSYSEAVIRCALIAEAHNWLGGVPDPGTCHSEIPE